jgi:hypothetical protein
LNSHHQPITDDYENEEENTGAGAGRAAIAAERFAMLGFLIGRIGWLWWLCIGIILVMVWSPFHLRYFALKLALAIVRARNACISAAVALELRAELVAVCCQLAVSRLHLRYLVLKRFVGHRFLRARRFSPTKHEIVNKPDKHGSS